MKKKLTTQELIEEEDETYCMETNLSCPKCDSFVMVYLPKEKETVNNGSF